VTLVTQPPAGATGARVTVTGTVSWVVVGHPGCVLLRTAHPQILALVGEPIDQGQHSAAVGALPATEPVRVTGYVPTGVATVCGALTFRAEQVTAMTH
jgi:hypothetical protein